MKASLPIIPGPEKAEIIENNSVQEQHENASTPTEVDETIKATAGRLTVIIGGIDVPPHAAKWEYGKPEKIPTKEGIGGSPVAVDDGFTTDISILNEFAKDGRMFAREPGQSIRQSEYPTGTATLLSVSSGPNTFKDSSVGTITLEDYTERPGEMRLLAIDLSKNDYGRNSDAKEVAMDEWYKGRDIRQASEKVEKAYEQDGPRKVQVGALEVVIKQDEEGKKLSIQSYGSRFALPLVIRDGQVLIPENGFGLEKGDSLLVINQSLLQEIANMTFTGFTADNNQIPQEMLLERATLEIGSIFSKSIIDGKVDRALLKANISKLVEFPRKEIAAGQIRDYQKEDLEALRFVGEGCLAVVEIK